MFLLLLCVSGALSYHHSGHFHTPPQPPPSQNWYPTTTGNNGHEDYQGHQVSNGYHSNYQSPYQFGQPYNSPNYQHSGDRTVPNEDTYETNHSNHQVDDNIHYEYPSQQNFEKFEPNNDKNKSSQSENGQDDHKPNRYEDSQNDTQHDGQYNTYNSSQPGNDNNTQEPSKSANDSDNTHNVTQSGNNLDKTHDLSQMESGQNNGYNSSPLKNDKNSATDDLIQSGNGHDKDNTNEPVLLGNDQNKTHQLSGNGQYDTHDSIQAENDRKNTHEKSQTGYNQSTIINHEVIQTIWKSKDTRYELNQDASNVDDTMPTPPKPTPPPLLPPPAEPGTGSESVPTLGELYAPAFQWHVGIYTKTLTPYMQICGGSLVKADVVISAAHCFWNDDVGVLRAALFAVAAGKLLRPWDITRESFAQHSDVKDIKIPPRFQGGRSSFQDDIAVVMMTSPFEYAPGVKPVCVSFDLELDRRQLRTGSKGTIAGWGLTLPNGPPSQRLNFLKLPYVDIEECVRSAEPSFLKYITSDKICAGNQRTGRALCRGDSGGGLVFYADAVPYLRGVASTAQRDANECYAYAIASFTHVLAHRTFLTDHVPDIAEGCEKLYDNGTRFKDTLLSATLISTSQQSTQEKITSSAYDLREQNGEVSNVSKYEKRLEDQKETEHTSEPEAVTKVTSGESMAVKINSKQELMKINVTKEEANTKITNSLSPCAKSEGTEKVATIKTKEPASIETSSQYQNVQSDGQIKAVNVWSGERRVTSTSMPAEDGTYSMFVCNCFCKH